MIIFLNVSLKELEWLLSGIFKRQSVQRVFLLMVSLLARFPVVGQYETEMNTATNFLPTIELSSEESSLIIDTTLTTPSSTSEITTLIITTPLTPSPSPSADSTSLSETIEITTPVTPSPSPTPDSTEVKTDTILSETTETANSTTSISETSFSTTLATPTTILPLTPSPENMTESAPLETEPSTPISSPTPLSTTPATPPTIPSTTALTSPPDTSPPTTPSTSPSPITTFTPPPTTTTLTPPPTTIFTPPPTTIFTPPPTTTLTPPPTTTFTPPPTTTFTFPPTTPSTSSPTTPPSTLSTASHSLPHPPSSTYHPGKHCHIYSDGGMEIADCSYQNLAINVPNTLNPNIQVLNLSGNSIINVNSKSFDRYKESLITLDLSKLKRGADFEQFSDDSFVSLQNLQYLDISESCLENSKFEFPGSLKTLKTNHCKTSTEPDLSNIESLSEFHAEDTGIITFPKFHPNAPLTYLDLRHNDLTNIQATNFASYCQLKKIDFNFDSSKSTLLNTAYCYCTELEGWLTEIEIEHVALNCQFGGSGKEPECIETKSEERKKNLQQQRKECLDRIEELSTTMNWLPIILLLLLIPLCCALPSFLFMRQKFARDRYDDDDVEHGRRMRRKRGRSRRIRDRRRRYDYDDDCCNDYDDDCCDDYDEEDDCTTTPPCIDVCPRQKRNKRRRIKLRCIRDDCFVKMSPNVEASLGQ